MKPEHISVILVEPQGPLNVGAVCRTMMNFGLSDLRLVAPCEDFQSEDARKMALNAKEMLQTASCHDTLASALSDVHTAFGTTRRFGKYRRDFLTPEQTAEEITGHGDGLRTALVFGREDTGLTTRELDMCQKFVTIPTSETFASMNLSHAVTILLWEIRKQTDRRTHDLGAVGKQAAGEELEQMYAHMKETLTRVEYLDPLNPDHLMRTYRRIFGRAGLYSRDVRIIRGLMSRIDWLEDQRRKPE